MKNFKAYLNHASGSLGVLKIDLSCNLPTHVVDGYMVSYSREMSETYWGTSFCCNECVSPSSHFCNITFQANAFKFKSKWTADFYTQLMSG